MTRARVAAAMAGILTVLLLQASVVAPASYPWPVSLPAIVVAAVALVDGPAGGMAFGFAAGFVADLGSHHPAGALALCWLCVGLVCGQLSDPRSVRRDALLTAVVCAVVSNAAVLLLGVLRGEIAPADVLAALRYVAPTALVDGVIALAVVPVVRAMLHSNALRAARPPSTAPLIGARHE